FLIILLMLKERRYLYSVDSKLLVCESLLDYLKHMDGAKSKRQMLQMIFLMAKHSLSLMETLRIRMEWCKHSIVKTIFMATNVQSFLEQWLLLQVFPLKMCVKSTYLNLNGVMSR